MTLYRGQEEEIGTSDGSIFTARSVVYDVGTSYMLSGNEASRLQRGDASLPLSMTVERT